MTPAAVFYRIHTENQEHLPAYVAEWFDFFNIVVGTGYWKGIPEKSATIEIIGQTEDAERVSDLANVIRHVFTQEAVYVTSHPVELTKIWTVKPAQVAQ